MVYLIVDEDNPGKVMLVKADSEEQVRSRMNLKSTEKVAGMLTDSELHVLDTAGFTVISP